MTTISVSLDDDLIEFLDQLVKKGVLESHSEAVRGGLFVYVKEKIGINSREQLREYLRKTQKKTLLSAVEVQCAIRFENDK